MTLTITKYQAWRFSTEEHRAYNSPFFYNKDGSKKGDFEQFEPRYPLAEPRDTFEEALADLVRCHEGSRNNPSYPDHVTRGRFDVVVPNPHLQFASGDLARKW